MNRHVVAVLIGVGLCAWLMFLVVSAPASIVTRIVDDIPQVAFERASGTLWNGHAQLHATGMEVGTIRWSVAPGGMLRGLLSLQVDLAGDDVHLSGILESSGRFGRKTRVRDLEGDITLALLARITGIERLLDASIGVHGSSLDLREGRPVAVEGTVTIDDTTLLAPRRTHLGRYRLQLSTTADGWLTAEIVSSEGPLSATGELALTGAGAWRMDLRLDADDREGDIAAGLAFLGAPDADGRHHIVEHGRF